MEQKEAVKLLRKAVKESHLKNQRHIDFSVLVAEERPIAQKALMFLQDKVKKGEMTDKELKTQLGL